MPAFAVNPFQNSSNPTKVEQSKTKAPTKAIIQYKFIVRDLIFIFGLTKVVTTMAKHVVIEIMRVAIITSITIRQLFKKKTG